MTLYPDIKISMKKARGIHRKIIIKQIEQKNHNIQSMYAEMSCICHLV